MAVSELQSIGYRLPISILVSDRDSGSNGDVSCTIEPAVYLSIEGCDTVRIKKQIDFEVLTELSATVTATDKGIPPLSRYLCSLMQLWIVTWNNDVFSYHAITIALNCQIEA